MVARAGRPITGFPYEFGSLGRNQDNLVVTYDPAAPLSGLAGQALQGGWTLRAADVAPSDMGTLNKWSLAITAG